MLSLCRVGMDAASSCSLSGVAMGAAVSIGGYGTCSSSTNFGRQVEGVRVLRGGS